MSTINAPKKIYQTEIFSFQRPFLTKKNNNFVNANFLINFYNN